MSRDTERPSWPPVEGEPSSRLARALEVARQDDSNAAQVARLAAALAPIYGASIASSAQAASSAGAASAGQAGATAGTAASATAGAGAAASVKIATAVIAAVALGTVGLMTLGAPAPSRQPDRPDAVKAPAEPQVRSFEVAVPQAVPVEPMPARARPVEPPRADEHEPDSNVVADPIGAAAPAPRVERARAERSHANAPVEAQLLTEAHAALTSDAARALLLADAHRARFPRGALAAERELLAVRALERQGRVEEAKQRIARARRELPRSAPVQRAAERLGALP